MGERELAKGTITRVESRAAHVPDPDINPRACSAPIPRKLVRVEHTAWVHLDDGSDVRVELGDEDALRERAESAMLDATPVSLSVDADGNPQIRLLVRAQVGERR